MKNNHFTEKIFFRLWYPAVFSSLGLAFADMADAFVVGQRMGATGLAAISLCLPVYMVINIIMHGLGLGGSSSFSKLLGEGDQDSAKKCFDNVIKASILVGLILAVLGNVFLQPILALLGTKPADGELYRAASQYTGMIIGGIPLFFLNYIMNYYLRNDNKQKLASVGFTVANVSDVVLNIVFVLIFDMGVFGAALSTLIAQFLAIIFYIPGIVDKHGFLKLNRQWISIRAVCGYFRNGFSISIQYLFQFIFLLIVNRMLLAYQGENGVAVFDLVQNVSFFVMYMYDSVSKAMQPLLSTYVGECNRNGLYRTRQLGMLIGGIVGGAVNLFIILAPQLVCRFFGIDGIELLGIAKMALRLYCLSALIGGISCIVENYEQACEREKNAVMMAFLRGIGVLVPCGLFFSMFQIQYFWFMYPITEILSVLIYIIWKKARGDKESLRSDKVYSYTISSTNQEISDLSEKISEFCEQYEIAMKKVFFISMAVEEICVAIMQNFKEENCDILMQVTVVVMGDESLELHIRDNAKHFNPFSLQSGKANEEDFDIDAVGMKIIQEKAEQFFYRRYQGFNTMVVKV